MQIRLVGGGCVEWVCGALVEGAGSQSCYSLECCAALLLNLSLRSGARAAMVPLATTLLPALVALLADRKPAVCWGYMRMCVCMHTYVYVCIRMYPYTRIDMI